MPWIPLSAHLRRATRIVSFAVLGCVSMSTMSADGDAAGLAQQRPSPPTNVRIIGAEPIISNIAVSGVTSSAATIAWATNKPTDAQVEYGTTTSYGSTSALNPNRATLHSVTLTGLASGTLYHFRVISRDASGAMSISARFNFTTTVVDDGSTSVVIWPQDTSLNLNATNYSSAAALTTYTWPDQRVANVIVMKFDLSSVPAGAVVHDATLSMTLVESDATADATYAISAHKITGPNPVIAATTGYTADGVTAWTPNACCSNSVPMAQADISLPYDVKAIDKTPGVKSWTLTALVQEWLTDPSTNFGLVLNSDATKLRDRYRYFASMEHGDTTLRPSLRVNYTAGPPDTIPPAVTISAPGPAALVSGTISVSATASDNVGVASVQFQRDGVNLGSADTLAPYTTSWNTSSVPPGIHTLRAIARDAAGNTTTSAAITVTVLDVTAPTVSITAPASGASVSGTVTVTAVASDAIGVGGVQFKVDGVNLGAEDTTAPHTASWNTTGVPNGLHTLTAVARDAAGNQRTSASVSVTVSNTVTPPSGGISALYPGDVGIESHPDVIFTEMFEQSSISTMTSRYNDVAHAAGMAFATSVPAGTGGARSLQMTTNGTNESAGLYKTFESGQQWYLRYYVNYNSAVQYGHTSAWLGGYNPMLSYPNPQAGTKPAGNDRFSTGVEPQAFDNDRWMSYTYWKDMRVAGDGKFWGNIFLPNDTSLRVARNRWYCVETMVKLNNPVTDSNGELAMWIDGTKILHLGKGFPNGTWSGGIFTQDPAGSPFPGFQWRSDPALNLNWIWLQNYVTGVPSSVQFDHVVLARSYVGCLGSGSSDTTPPAVSLSAPTAGATVSGTAATVSANATDAGGIAGVQFKLDGANLGAEDTTAPYSVSWNTTLSTNASHTLTAVARDAAGNTTTSSPVTVTVSNTIPVTGAWPNEPAGFTLLNDQPWNLLTGNGWNYLRRSSSKDATIVTDTTAPLSPLNALRMVFTTDMQRDSEPSVHWMGLSGVKEIYTAWWMKVSPNWSCSAAGCGKLTFLFTSTGGQVYTNIYHPPSSTGPPFQVGANTEWAPYGQRIWLPNVTTTLVHPGQWHRIEFYYRWETTPGVSQDGIIRWWVDGVLNGNHTNVHYPSSSFNEFQFAPTLQSPPPAEQYMYIDHTRVSRKQ